MPPDAGPDTPPGYAEIPRERRGRSCGAGCSCGPEAIKRRRWCDLHRCSSSKKERLLELRQAVDNAAGGLPEPKDVATVIMKVLTVEELGAL